MDDSCQACIEEPLRRRRGFRNNIFERNGRRLDDVADTGLATIQVDFELDDPPGDPAPSNAEIEEALEDDSDSVTDAVEAAGVDGTAFPDGGGTSAPTAYYSSSKSSKKSKSKSSKSGKKSKSKSSKSYKKSKKYKGYYSYYGYYSSSASSSDDPPASSSDDAPASSSDDAVSSSDDASSSYYGYYGYYSSKKGKKYKSSKSKSSKKSKKSKKSKSGKKSKSKSSKSSKKSKSAKSCKSGKKSGKSSKKCDDRNGDFVDVEVVAEISNSSGRRRLQAVDAAAATQAFETCLNAVPTDGANPFVAMCVPEFGGAFDLFICEATKENVLESDAQDVADDIQAAFNDGSLDRCIGIALPGFGISVDEIIVQTDAPTSRPTEAPVAPTLAPTLAPSASAYPTTAAGPSPTQRPQPTGDDD